MAGKPPPFLKLDETPTFLEERRDFQNEQAYSGEKPFDEGAAKGRIDRIARWLAILWSFFLIYIIVAQGLERPGRVRVSLVGIDWMVVPAFTLNSADFIAVVTTTTVTVFGFLVIVANHLFHKDKRSPQ